MKEAKEQPVSEIVKVKSMELPPKIMALLRSCRSSENSRYAMRHAFVIDGRIYTSNGRIAASIQFPPGTKQMEDGICFMVDNEVIRPAQYEKSFPPADKVFLAESKLEKLSDMTTDLLSALIKHKVYVDVFRFVAMLHVLDSMELMDCWLHADPKDGTEKPVMVSGSYVQCTGSKKCHAKLRSKISGPWEIRVVMMPFHPSTT